ncbi:hypothetical protein QJS10_CPB22g00612 [Acorus calamus]|uniref:Uncharacterized protein n=1 Tax=Acorus calamus TaxID=4465 RepID=A0AAV9BZ23_ACOCL|nr:hypothetical protein QJS10_CPB22g00612 [Acorus calamus]
MGLEERMETFALESPHKASRASAITPPDQEGTPFRLSKIGQEDDEEPTDAVRARDSTGAVPVVPSSSLRRPIYGGDGGGSPPRGGIPFRLLGCCWGLSFGKLLSDAIEMDTSQSKSGSKESLAQSNQFNLLQNLPTELVSEGTTISVLSEGSSVSEVPEDIQVSGMSLETNTTISKVVTRAQSHENAQGQSTQCEAITMEESILSDKVESRQDTISPKENGTLASQGITILDSSKKQEEDANSEPAEDRIGTDCSVVQNKQLSDPKAIEKSSRMEPQSNLGKPGIKGISPSGQISITHPVEDSHHISSTSQNSQRPAPTRKSGRKKKSTYKEANSLLQPKSDQHVLQGNPKKEQQQNESPASDQGLSSLPGN